MSIGDLVMGAMGGGSPGQQINQALQGPQPGPGGSGVGGTQMPQTGGMAGPQATQSPPDLANLYVKLMQQSRNANDFDRNLALFAGGFKGPPGGADRLMNAVAPAQDPGAMLQNLMQIRNMQAMQNLPMPGGGEAGAGGTAVAGTPDPNAPDPRVWAAMPPEMKMKYWQNRMQSGMEVSQQGAEQKQKDLLEAQDKAPAMNTQLLGMDKLSNDIKDAVNADGTPALKGILDSPWKKGIAMKLLSTDPKEEPGVWMQQLYTSRLSPEEQGVLQKVKTLDNQIYGEAFQSTGSRRTGTEVANLRAGLSPLKNFNQDYDHYMSQYGDFTTQLHKSIGNNLGSAGELDSIPEQYRWGPDGKPLIESSYLPGGEKYVKGGEWTKHPPQQHGGGGGDFNYTAIPSGTVYTAPDGTQRRKP